MLELSRKWIEKNKSDFGMRLNSTCYICSFFLFVAVAKNSFYLETAMKSAEIR